MKEEEFIVVCEDFIAYETEREKGTDYADKSNLCKIYRLLYHLAYRNEKFLQYITEDKK